MKLPNPMGQRAECFYNKFSSSQPQCENHAMYQSSGHNNLVDSWTWCIKHAPSKDYRISLTKEEIPCRAGMTSL